jgi:hypothetical protein
MSSQYRYFGSVMAILGGLASAQVTAQSVKFPQRGDLRWDVVCTRSASSEAVAENEPNVIAFGFTANSYSIDRGHVYAGPVESDVDWVRPPSDSKSNDWRLSRSSGELTIIDKHTGASTTYTCEADDSASVSSF